MDQRQVLQLVPTASRKQGQSRTEHREELTETGDRAPSWSQQPARNMVSPGLTQGRVDRDRKQSPQLVTAASREQGQSRTEHREELTETGDKAPSWSQQPAGNMVSPGLNTGNSY